MEDMSEERLEKMVLEHVRKNAGRNGNSAQTMSEDKVERMSGIFFACRPIGLCNLVLLVYYR